MKNKKKINTIFIIFLILIVCSFCLLLKLYFSTNSYIKILKMNWDIVLPKEENQLFHYSEPSPHGDGIRYHVIDYPGDESKHSQNIVFQLEKNFLGASQPTKDQIDYVNQLLAKIDVDDKYIPDWNRCLLVYKRQTDNSELFLFYYSDTATLYILESFI